ncbi:MAG: Rieske (2Fe-2S) protein [Candidatus Nanopelagicaceae bacterium]
MERRISRRALIGTLAFSSFATSTGLLSQSAAAMPKAKCVRVGQKIVSGGFSYRCVRSSGRLVWKKGKRVRVAISPSPSPTPTSSPTATPTPTPTPSSTPTPTPTPTPSPTQTTRRAGYFVAKSSDVILGESKLFFATDLAGRTVRHSLFRSATGVSALDVICTHNGCLVTPEKAELVCRCHFSYFDAATGARKSGPADAPLRSYQVSEIEGEIYIIP